MLEGWNKGKTYLAYVALALLIIPGVIGPMLGIDPGQTGRLSQWTGTGLLALSGYLHVSPNVLMWLPPGERKFLMKLAAGLSAFGAWYSTQPGAFPHPWDKLAMTIGGIGVGLSAWIHDHPDEGHETADPGATTTTAPTATPPAAAPAPTAPGVA